MKRYFALALLFGWLPACTTPTNVSQVTANSPYAYCSIVGTVDKPELSVANKQNNAEIVAAMKRSGVIAQNEKLPDEACRWRCMEQAVYACCTGANLPCDSKADTDRTPKEGMNQYCAQNPNAAFIPAAATGHTTVYEWACAGKKAVAGKQILEVDPQGYHKEFWHKASAL